MAWHSSLRNNHFFHGILGNSTQHVFPPIFKNEGNGFGKIFSTFFNGASLPIRSGNLRAIGYVPLFISFDNRCEFVAHTTSPYWQDLAAQANRGLFGDHITAYGR